MVTHSGGKSPRVGKIDTSVVSFGGLPPVPPGIWVKTVGILEFSLHRRCSIP